MTRRPEESTSAGAREIAPDVYCLGPKGRTRALGPLKVNRGGFAGRALGVLAFGIAFGYVEAAVVAYLQTALGIPPEPLFPLRQATGEAGRLLGIEVGRELAALVMLGTIGWVVGASRLERLAWSAVAFGAWDLAYYGWLWVLSGWPPALTSWDVLFLVPVPWTGPVWAPTAVSLSLIGVGLLAARRLRRGDELRLARWQVAGGLAGGVLVVASFILDAPDIVAGGVPREFAWPVFGAGMLLAGAAAVAALRGQAAGAPRSAPVDRIA